jgi:peptide/nickel transport system substrate-binding protein
MGLWPVMPCYSNLVLFDPLKPRETPETIIPELAEKWSWQDGYRSLVFFLRKGVKWHDGAPFTSADVKYTFDVVREAKDAPAKLRVNARKEWYGNVESIETPEPHTVIFRLTRPQPSLLSMLASGYSPVLPAHVPLSALRTKCVGTGPFRLKEYALGQMIEMERNPDYFVKDRPYLDGIRDPIITERGTRQAALQAGRLDVSLPTQMTKVMADTLKKAVRLIDLQSQELDPKKRLALVLDIQRRLEEDVAKPMLGWRNAYFARWPDVKNLVPHAPVYNFARMQDVWLDR